MTNESGADDDDEIEEERNLGKKLSKIMRADCASPPAAME